MLENISGTELVIVSLVLLFMFGSKKLPEFAKGLGESAKELKKARKEFNQAMKSKDED